VDDCSVIADVSLLVTFPENVDPSFSVTVAAEPDAGAVLLLQPHRPRIVMKIAVGIFGCIIPPIVPLIFSLLPDRVPELREMPSLAGPALY
jgi:hypothetical protein